MDELNISEIYIMNINCLKLDISNNFWIFMIHNQIFFLNTNIWDFCVIIFLFIDFRFNYCLNLSIYSKVFDEDSFFWIYYDY